MIPLRVMTLNINTAHGPKGQTGTKRDFRDRIPEAEVRNNLERIGSQINGVEAHIVCLAEVDRIWGGTGKIDQIKYLSRITKMPYYAFQTHLKSPLPEFMRNFKLPRADIIFNRDCGTAILSKYPIVASEHYDFGQSFRQTPFLNYWARLLNECKGYTFVELDINGMNVGTYSVHLLNDIVYEILRHLGRTLRGETFARVWQVEKLIQKVQEKLRERRIPLIVAGDFNSIPRESDFLEYGHSVNGDRDNYRRDMTQYLLRESNILRTIPVLFGSGTPETIRPYNTYPGSEEGPAERVLDYIFVTKSITIDDYRVIKNPVSDHLAVVADLWIEPYKEPLVKPLRV